MIYFEIKDRVDNSILASSLKDCPGLELFENSPGESAQKGSYKNIVREDPRWTIRLIASKDEDLAKSNRIAARTAEFFVWIAPVLKGFQRDQATGYKTFSHNLITTHAQLQGEVESILPEIHFIDAKNHLEQVEIARRDVAQNPNGASEALLAITKLVGDLQAQIQGFKILANEAVPDFAAHNIKKILSRIIQPFQEKFREKNLDIRIHIGTLEADTKKVRIDYKLFSVAMHHFLNNVIKYAKPKSYVDISFDFGTRTLVMEMISVKIEPDEIERIFKFGESGIHAQAFSGEGIGMYMTGRSLEVMGSHMDINVDESFQEEVLGVPYTRNRFSIPMSMV